MYTLPLANALTSSPSVRPSSPLLAGFPRSGSLEPSDASERASSAATSTALPRQCDGVGESRQSRLQTRSALLKTTALQGNRLLATPSTTLAWYGCGRVSTHRRANMAHVRQSRPGSGLGFHVEDLKTFGSVPSALRSGKTGRDEEFQ